MSNQLNVFDVMAPPFNASGTGVSDDSGAILKALAAASALPAATLLFQAGTYLYDSPVPISIPSHVQVFTIGPAGIVGGLNTTDCFIFEPNTLDGQNGFQVGYSIRHTLPAVSQFYYGTGVRFVDSANQWAQIPVIHSCRIGCSFEGRGSTEFYGCNGNTLEYGNIVFCQIGVRFLADITDGRQGFVQGSGVIGGGIGIPGYIGSGDQPNSPGLQPWGACIYFTSNTPYQNVLALNFAKTLGIYNVQNLVGTGIYADNVGLDDFYFEAVTSFGQFPAGYIIAPQGSEGSYFLIQADPSQLGNNTRYEDWTGLVAQAFPDANTVRNVWTMPGFNRYHGGAILASAAPNSRSSFNASYGLGRMPLGGTPAAGNTVTISLAGPITVSVTYTVTTADVASPNPAQRMATIAQNICNEVNDSAAVTGSGAFLKPAGPNANLPDAGGGMAIALAALSEGAAANAYTYSGSATGGGLTISPDAQTNLDAGTPSISNVTYLQMGLGTSAYESGDTIVRYAYHPFLCGPLATPALSFDLTNNPNPVYVQSVTDNSHVVPNEIVITLRVTATFTPAADTYGRLTVNG